MNLTGTYCLLCCLKASSRTGLSAKPHIPDNQKYNLTELIFLIFIRQGKLHFWSLKYSVKQDV